MDISPLKLAYNKRNYHARKINSSCLLFARSCPIEKMCTYIIQGDFFNWIPENFSRLRPWTVPLDWSPYFFLVLKSYSLLQALGHFLIMGAEGGQFRTLTFTFALLEVRKLTQTFTYALLEVRKLKCRVSCLALLNIELFTGLFSEQQ